MTRDKTSTRPADTELVAYLDGELAPADSVRLGQTLAADAETKKRLDQLIAGARPFGEAFAPLLDAAPKAKLDAMLDQALRRPRPAVRPQVSARRLGLVAAALALLAGGAGLDHIVNRGVLRTVFADQHEAEGAEWRGAVAEYLALYTRDTLARIPAQVADRDLSQAGDRLGLAMTSAKVSLGDLALKRADLYDYDGRPLAFLAYLDPRHGPVAFCIVAGGDPSEMRTETRQDMNVVYWADRGHSYMLIGRAPSDQLGRLAAGVRARFAGDTGRAG